MKTLKFYFAFKRFRNFACLEVHPKNRVILVYVKVDSRAWNSNRIHQRHAGSGIMELVTWRSRSGIKMI